MANLLICKNPFRPQLDRELVPVRNGSRIDTVLRGQELISGRGKKLVRNHSFVVQLNGEWLLQEQWTRRVAADDALVVVFLPAGGGGGSNPLQIVAMVALVVAAPMVAPALGLAAGTVGASLVTAGVMIAGGLLLSAIFPPPKPPSTMAREQASPTYTIGAQGNMARLMESIPVQYGRFRAYPDFAAQPYNELDGNQAYLYQLFCLGQGEYDIEEIRIEDTPIGNFEEVEYEIVRPGERVTLFPDNVVSSTAVQSIELKGPNEAGHATVGPFVANPSGTTTNKIAIDIVLPAGLFYANDGGGMDSRSASWSVVAHPIDDAGNSAGASITLGNETFSAATNTAQMMTYRYDVPEGRYSVSVVRTSNKDTSSRAGNTLQWGGMRAYLPDHRDYGDVTLIAMIIRATNNLNQSTARRVNVISTRKLRTWHPEAGWSAGVTATRNPAWALADACVSKTYGRGLRDSRINLQALYRLAQIWDERGDNFDGVFDTTTTLWDALTRIARVGRAMPMYYAGVIDFIRNEPKSVKTQMFTPMNIVTNTFSVDYIFPEHDSPDHVIVEFINEETWQADEVVCALPGSPMLRPHRLQMPGITNRSHAWREGIALAAQNRDQRRFVSFQTELEGNIPRYGDLVEVSHDVPKWGLSGFIEGYDPETKTLVTSEPLEWWPQENHYISLRKKDGSPDGPYRVVSGQHEREVLIADKVDGYSIYVSDGQGEEFTHYQFGPGERRALLAQAVSATPDDQGKVTLELVNYAESVHTAELGGAVPAPTPPSLLPSTTSAPIVDSVAVYASPVPGEQEIYATPARGADRYQFRASNDLGATWLDLGTHFSNSITARLQAGMWRVQARGIGAMQGPWATWQGAVSATMAPPPALRSLTTQSEIMAITVFWLLPAAPWIRSVEVWQSLTPNFVDATLLGEYRPTQLSHTIYGLRHGAEMWFWARIRDDADQPGPWFPDANAMGIRGQASVDASDILDYINGQIGTEQFVDWVNERIEAIPDLIDDVSALGAQVADLLSGSEWDPASEYATGDVVYSDGKMYRATQAVPAGTPVSEAVYWQYIGDFASLGDAVAGLAINVSETQARVEEIDGEIQAVASTASSLVAQRRHDDSGDGLLTDVLNEFDSRAMIQQNSTAIADESGARAEMGYQLAVEIGSTKSRITTVEQAVVTDRQAQASVNQTVQAQLGDQHSAIQQNSTAIASVEEGVVSKWRLKTQANGVVAGMEIGAEDTPSFGQTSYVRFVADVLQVINLTNGVATTPFVVQDGVVVLEEGIAGRLTIGNAQIEDASITTAKIANAGIDFAKIKNVVIDKADIRNLTVGTLDIENSAVSEVREFRGSGTMYLYSLVPASVIVVFMVDVDPGGTSLNPVINLSTSVKASFSPTPVNAHAFSVITGTQYEGDGGRSNRYGYGAFTNIAVYAMPAGTHTIDYGLVSGSSGNRGARGYVLVNKR